MRVVTASLLKAWYSGGASPGGSPRMAAPPGGPNWRYSPNKAGCIAASFELTTPPIHQTQIDPERRADRARARTQLPKTMPNSMHPVANALE